MKEFENLLPSEIKRVELLPCTIKSIPPDDGQLVTDRNSLLLL